MKPHSRVTTACRKNTAGFSCLDAVAIIVILSLLTLVALPALASNRTTAVGVTCVGNLGNLTRAWQLYAADNSGKVANNFGIADTMGTVSAQTYLNWTHNIMDWTTNPSNTNRTWMAASKLYPYLENPNNPFKCPADRFISAAQSQAGWSGGRLRSYSMNGFMGPNSRDVGDVSYQGQNFLASNYRQFILSSSIPSPQSTIVLLDEHPDSINDGYFINVPNSSQWYDLPGSHHNGAAGVSFADGHVDMHSWLYAATRQPVRFGFLNVGPISASQRADHTWLTEKMSVLHQTLTLASSASETKVIWTPSNSTFRLQSSPILTAPDWKNVPETATRASGQVNISTSTGSGQRYFRLVRP